MTSRPFLHPVTLFALMFAFGVFVFEMLGALTNPESSLASDNPPFVSMVLLLRIVFVLFYPVLLGWYIFSIPTRPPVLNGNGPTSRIHHPYSLLIFPAWWLTCVPYACLSGLLGFELSYTAQIKEFLLASFLSWWVIPIEWWDGGRRELRAVSALFSGERPILVRVVRVALIGTGLPQRRDGSREPAFSPPPFRPVSPAYGDREGLDWEALTELGASLVISLLYRLGFYVVFFT